MARPMAHLFAAVLTLGLAGVLFAAERGEPVVQWAAVSLQGESLEIPAADRPSLMLFIRPGHARSNEALGQVRKAVREGEPLQIVIVVSGPEAAARAGELRSGEHKVPWPVVEDADFETSGRMGVHAWPSTLVVDSQGNRVGFIPGLPADYLKSLAAYIAAARGEIDEQELKRRLATNDVVMDSAEQRAARHLKVAQQLLTRGRAEQALSELERGGEQSPDNPKIKLATARALARLDRAEEALTWLDRIDPGELPPWQTLQTRGRALLMLGRFGEAQKVLERALHLNPDPATASYLLGVAYQRQRKYEEAAEAFRRAFESTDTGGNHALPRKRQGVGAGSG